MIFFVDLKCLLASSSGAFVVCNRSAFGTGSPIALCLQISSSTRGTHSDAFQPESGCRADVATLGTAGSGKSTVLALLVRFYEPAGGKRMLDGNDFQNIELYSFLGFSKL